MGALLRRPSRLALLPLLAALAAALAACSPESARVRGDGLGTGADPDNHRPPVEMHGEVDQDQRIYRDTPNRLPSGAEGAVE